MKAQVLLFCFSDPARLSAVRKALLPLHIPCRVVPEEDWTAPLGALAGLETEAPAAAIRSRSDSVMWMQWASSVRGDRTPRACRNSVGV